ncbi:hypothetical protein TELCIR_02093 [Teladorsagia circumcincta]|uniref:Uncharacterized protein n=1 Tax=Teladorsagia circumcincta TaxID=45464 RepID=A0A2G9V050_TELCI|nr:hypothetical protein TELCIR_02093 [Teladorsagia circumcincta]
MALDAGILCDKKLPQRLEAKIYRALACLSVETKILRWTGVTRLDHTRNDTVGERFGVAIAQKTRELALDGTVTFFVLMTTVSVKSSRMQHARKRPRGRPKQRWLDTLHENRN